MAVDSRVILYFIAGPNPTETELQAAKQLGTSRFRVARLAENDPVEPCDAVAGAVPEAYKNLENVEVLGAASMDSPKIEKPAEDEPKFEKNGKYLGGKK